MEYFQDGPESNHTFTVFGLVFVLQFRGVLIHVFIEIIHVGRRILNGICNPIFFVLSDATYSEVSKQSGSHDIGDMLLQHPFIPFTFN
jgi:hypothetical protein